MITALCLLLAAISGCLRARSAIQLENLALRHQLNVYQRTVPRPRIQPADRIFWSWLSRWWSAWRESLVFVQPTTVIAWRRRKFREHWTKISRPGRPRIAKELRDLIRQMSTANPTWGAPRILGELQRLGIDVAKSTVERYMVRRKRPSSATWATFLRNHLSDVVSIDFFTVPTIKHKILFVFVVLSNERRRILHFNVTAHPTAAWTSQQLIEAFPWTTPPPYLLRDGDGIYGEVFQATVVDLGMRDKVIGDPWMSEVGGLHHRYERRAA